MGFKRQIAGLMLGWAAFAAAGAAVVVMPSAAFAQDQQEDEQPRRRSETLDPAVARSLQGVFEQMQAEQYQAALAGLNQLISERGDRMKPFDRATTYELRGSVYASLENYPAALRDFQTALDTGALPPDRNNQLRYFIAQLHFQLEQYQQAINGLDNWIRSAQAAGQTVDPNAYYLLAAAYVQLQPPNYRAAMPNAERVVAARGSGPEPKKADFDLLNLIYSELGENNKRASLLERMINIWPGERSYWTQLAGLYSTTGKDREAFAVLEVAYRAGLLEREGEIVTLINYYSFFDNPYRGAKVLDREMQAGRVDRDLDNLVLLSQLYSQSREHKRAIPVLREAAQMSDKGELSYRLGQVLLADEQYAAAERALVSALNKGGMNSRQTGDAWMLLGTARFSQAGPGDRATRARAREAFVNARRYSTAARQAGDWITYIDAINDTERRQDELERTQRIEALRDNIERLRTQNQVCRLQNQGNCDQFEERIAQQRAELERLSAGGPAAQEEAPAADAEPGADESAEPEDAAEQEGDAGETE